MSMLWPKKEKKNWVYKRVRCLPSKNKEPLCLILLSDGGKDSFVLREFDLTQKKFVADGFNVKEGKTRFSWLDEDHLLIATDFDKNYLTDSHYPRIVKLWRRGTPLEDAKVIMEGKRADTSIYSYKLNPQSQFC